MATNRPHTDSRQTSGLSQSANSHESHTRLDMLRKARTSFEMLGLLMVIMFAGNGLIPFHAADAFDDMPTPTFDAAILPVLKSKCLNCHGDKKLRANLDLRNLPAL